MKLTSIKFTCQWVEPPVAGRVATCRCIKSPSSIPVHRIEKTEFKLGPGPCGQNVIKLEVEFNDAGLEVSQFCEDGSAKSFAYLTKDIVGRIERTFEDN